MKKIGLVLLALVVVAGAAWLLDSTSPREVAVNGDTSAGNQSGLSVPVLLDAVADAGRVRLRWRPEPGAVAYHLWRSDGPEENPQVIYIGRDTSFEDRADLNPNRRYCYQLTVVDPEFDESGFSEPKCVAIPWGLQTAYSLDGGNEEGKR